jgi:hypothetical protein
LNREDAKSAKRGAGPVSGKCVLRGLGVFAVQSLARGSVRAAAGSWDTTGLILNDVEWYDGRLFLASFHSAYSGADTIYRLTTALFACDFECGDQECWSAAVGE